MLKPGDIFKICDAGVSNCWCISQLLYDNGTHFVCRIITCTDIFKRVYFASMKNNKTLLWVDNKVESVPKEWPIHIYKDIKQIISKYFVEML